ncbi:carboxylesterase type B [Phaeosphaeria sp. MPI-PUGE-AT-0046c]|nr:carboxylesterase type B [Phaeosphaeria sp. MPI-PUGE-AT-0046c]
MVLASFLLIAFTQFGLIASLPNFPPPGLNLHKEPQPSRSNELVVDLGYELYAGVANTSTGLNVFKGIRFAAPPTGPLRWQTPRSPTTNRVPIINATSFGAACTHELRAGQSDRALPSPISEDCLFLNVYAPQKASNLPVLVHIHGGGYALGDGREDMSRLINENQNGFVGVNIQYRLGAFGFLAGDEVFRNGVVNAGLLDQQFALMWVKEYIGKFGGDAQRVTNFGISAGGGSVMLRDMAYGGTQGAALFTNSISFSPYLPQQHDYHDWAHSQAYYNFAVHAGCALSRAHDNATQTVFQCLVSKDTKTLMAAASAVSASGLYGTWSFLPVTGGDLVQYPPSRALLGGKLNGMNHLTSNVAEESYVFVPQNISTKEALRTYLGLVFTNFGDDDFDVLFSRYSISTAGDAVPRFSTSGGEGLTALQTSATASGYQQIANLIYAESTFICPSYWLADSYSTGGRKAYKMQYSVPIALHGYDGIAVFGNLRIENQGDDLVKALQRIVGNFVRTGSPNGPFEIMGMQKQGLGAFAPPDYPMLNAGLNVLGAKWLVGPGLRNKFTVVNGFDWEGGRGERCEFWRGVADKVPM